MSTQLEGGGREFRFPDTQCTGNVARPLCPPFKGSDRWDRQSIPPSHPVVKLQSFRSQKGVADRSLSLFPRTMEGFIESNPPCSRATDPNMRAPEEERRLAVAGESRFPVFVIIDHARPFSPGFIANVRGQLAFS